VLTLDTSGILALLVKGDPWHDACVAMVAQEWEPMVIPAAILAEVGWYFERDFGPEAEARWLEQITASEDYVAWERRDLPRIAILVRRYADLRLGLADAAVIACAERHDGRVLTTDRRHFPVVARGERTITVLPEDQ
jgi:predicted nucleic acid-binding protein